MKNKTYQIELRYKDLSVYLNQQASLKLNNCCFHFVLFYAKYYI